MPSSALQIAALVAAVLAAAVAAFVVFRRRRESRIRGLLASQWGSASDRRFTADELAAIRRQAQALAGPAGFSVDDITWNDLDMDRLYERVNAACTDAGDHALYGMLRNPCADPGELGRRERFMAWIRTDGEGRERLKRILFDLGRTGLMDLEAPFTGNWYSKWRLTGCVALSAGLALGIALCAFGVLAALIPSAVLAIVNVSVSLRSRSLIGSYIAVTQSIPPMLLAARRIANERVEALAEEDAAVLGRLERVKSIMGSGVLAFHNSYNNPTDLMMYFNLFFLMELIGFYRLTRSVRRHRDDIVGVYGYVGRVDALIAAASWRETLKAWCAPELDGGASGRSIRFEGIVHPMLEDPVPNSLEIGRNVLLTGSNATGKSTFLKTVAINAILAQSLHTCSAARWSGGFFRVHTSMALRDDLFGNESYFVTEIKSLKRMLDGMEGDVPGLFIVDEVLRGTNTGERIAAASEALRQFCRGNCVCLAATHDIELTHILDGLYENMHFTETILDGRIAFDYRIRPGRSTSRNAIKLLAMLGYGEGLVRAANARLERFEETGRWDAAEEDRC